MPDGPIELGQRPFDSEKLDKSIYITFAYFLIRPNFEPYPMGELK